MKAIKLLILALVAVSVAACSTTREISEADMLKYNVAVEQMQNRQFMIKANRITVDRHPLPFVSSITNFVLVDGDDAVVQVSPGNGGGPNGVGGFTVKGRITSYEVKVKSNGDVNVKYNVQATVGSCSVFINLPKGSTDAIVTINNNMRGKNAILYGTVSAIDNSIHIGYTRY